MRGQCQPGRTGGHFPPGRAVTRLRRLAARGVEATADALVRGEAPWAVGSRTRADAACAERPRSSFAWQGGLTPRVNAPVRARGRAARRIGASRRGAVPNDASTVEAGASRRRRRRPAPREPTARPTVRPRPRRPPLLRRREPLAAGVAMRPPTKRDLDRRDGDAPADEARLEQPRRRGSADLTVRFPGPARFRTRGAGPA